VRTVYARRLMDVPVSATAPLPLFERVVDAAAMLFLAGCGAAAFGGPVIAVCLVGGAAVAALVVWRLPRLLGAATTRLRARAHRIEPLFDSSARLFRPRPVAFAFAIGLAAWALECVAFYLVLAGLGVDADAGLMAKAAFVYPVATLVGTLSLLPGGLGITEGGIAGMLQAVAGVAAGPAAGAALLIRVVIIAPGLVFGLPPLLLLGRESLRAVPEPDATGVAA
jgi:uncharacterized membrane protein YbhN (UPF0104 family)